MKRKEAGLILPLVLILLLFGGLVAPPLLAYTSTALRSGSAVEGRVLELYAADSGIEDARSRIGSGDIPVNYYEPFIYYVDNEAPLGPDIASRDIINGKWVQVTMERVKILEGLENISSGSTPGVTGTVTGRAVDASTYVIEVTYESGAGAMLVNRVGVWVPDPYQYVDGSTSGDLTFPGDNPDEVVKIAGGTAYRWQFDPPVLFLQVGGTKELVFTLAPSIPAPEPWWVGDFAWIAFSPYDGSEFLASDPTATKLSVSAKAIDPATEAVLTKVRSNVISKEGSTFLQSWEIKVY